MANKIELLEQLMLSPSFANIGDIGYDNDRRHINVIGRQKHAKIRNKKNKIAKQSRRKNRK